MEIKIPVDVDLLLKYSKSGPRYTSYPTAPHFHDGIGAEEYIRHLTQDNTTIKNRNLSLYFHIPFCDTLCYFCGCHMTVSNNQKRIGQYLDYLEKEVDLTKNLIDPDRQVIQLHWGGGTPTHLSPEQIRTLGEFIRSRFELHPDAEISAEIDPRELTFDHLEALNEIGFNRVSMGVQTFDPTVQRAINRIQPESVTRKAFEWSRSLGFSSQNIDLMYGLPHQTVSTLENTLNTVIDIDPNRIALFNYAHLPHVIRHQKLIKDEWLPDTPLKLQMLKLSIDKLQEAGYVFIGMDHFAKPDDELTLALKDRTLYRNFQGYSTHAGINLLAFGVSSISMLSDLYVQNHKKFVDYYQALEQNQLPAMRGVALSPDDQLRRDVINRLMCHFYLDKKLIESEYQIHFDDHFYAPLQRIDAMQEDGLVIHDSDQITITPAGRLLIRNIAMEFDAYLGQTTHSYSRTI